MVEDSASEFGVVSEQLVSQQQRYGHAATRQISDFLEIVKWSWLKREEPRGLDRALASNDDPEMVASAAVLETVAWLWRHFERHEKEFNPRWTVYHEYQLRLFRLGCAPDRNDGREVPIRTMIHQTLAPRLKPQKCMLNFVKGRAKVLRRLDDRARHEEETFQALPAAPDLDPLAAVGLVVRVAATKKTRGFHVLFARARLRKVESAVHDGRFSFPELLLALRLLRVPSTVAEAKALYAILDGTPTTLARIARLDALLATFWLNVAEDARMPCKMPFEEDYVLVAIAAADARSRRSSPRTVDPPIQKRRPPTAAACEEEDDVVAWLRAEHVLHSAKSRALAYHQLRRAFVAGLERDDDDEESAPPPPKPKRRHLQPSCRRVVVDPVSVERFALQRRREIAVAARFHADASGHDVFAPDHLRKKRHDVFVERAKEVSRDLALQRKQRLVDDGGGGGGFVTKRRPASAPPSNHQNVLRSNKRRTTPLCASSPTLLRLRRRRRRKKTKTPASPARCASSPDFLEAQPPELPTALGPQTLLYEDAPPAVATARGLLFARRRAATTT